MAWRGGIGRGGRRPGCRGREAERQLKHARSAHGLDASRRLSQKGGRTWEAGERGRGVEAVARLVLWEHGVGVGLALGGVGRGDGVDDGLCLFVADFCRKNGQNGGSEGGRVGLLTLVVVDDVAEVVAAAVVRLANAHGVVGEVDIAVVAWDEKKGGQQSRGVSRAGPEAGGLLTEN